MGRNNLHYENCVVCGDIKMVERMKKTATGWICNTCLALGDTEDD